MTTDTPGMKDVSDVLREIQAEQHSFGSPDNRLVRFYFVVDDPELDQPQVADYAMSESRLARMESRDAAESFATTLMMNGLLSWRHDDEEA